MLKRISGRELAEWAAFERVYGPIGVEARVDQAAALIAERVTNCLVQAKPRPTQNDFIPRWNRRLIDEDEDGGADG